jgi:hypothetical protein
LKPSKSRKKRRYFSFTFILKITLTFEYLAGRNLRQV